MKSLLFYWAQFLLHMMESLDCAWDSHRCLHTPQNLTLSFTSRNAVRGMRVWGEVWGFSLMVCCFMRTVLFACVLVLEYHLLVRHTDRIVPQLLSKTSLKVHSVSPARKRAFDMSHAKEPQKSTGYTVCARTCTRTWEKTSLWPFLSANLLIARDFFSIVAPFITSPACFFRTSVLSKLLILKNQLID